MEDILVHLESGVNNCVIFVDFLASLDDEWNKNSGLQYNWFHGEEVYSLVSRDNPNNDKIETILRASESYASFCVLSSIMANEYSKVEPYTEIKSDLLKGLATNLSGIFVGAYDHEGFLKWGKRVKPI